MIYVLLALVVALLAAWIDLFVLRRGFGFTYHPNDLPFRVRRNSWLIWLIHFRRPKNAPAAGLALGRTVHLWVNRVPVTSWLVAHEVAHLIRSRGKVVSYLIKYFFNKQFKADEQKACDDFAYQHRFDSPFRSVVELVNKANTPEEEQDDANRNG